jgi:hypothetical protein
MKTVPQCLLSDRSAQPPIGAEFSRPAAVDVTPRRKPPPRKACGHDWRRMHNPDARACIKCGAIVVQLRLPLYSAVQR